MISDYCYDIEVYPNVFTCTVTGVVTGDSRCYEISTRKNDLGPFKNFIDRIARRRSRMIGFNNINYDYPVIHYLLTELFDLAASWDFICKKLFEKSKSIIEAPFHSRFKHRISPTKYLVDQIDLSLIHHFDNQAKMTSLKVLEFNMRMTDIEELPFAPETYLTPKQIETLVKYNLHDVRATLDFYKHSLDHIKFREALSVKYGRNFLNHNDTKIGKDYFVMQLEQKIGLTACYTMENNEKKVKQTKRETIALADIIFPYVSFNTYAFQTVLEWLKDQVITETKGVFTDLTDEQMSKFLHHSPSAKKKKLTKKDRKLSVMLDDTEFVFGTGGIHASINNTRVQSDAENVILDLDVTSYYPSLAIVNRLYPEHLGEEFCDIYADMKEQRLKFAKGTPENAMLKLALNGVYGDSNNKFSPFYDPQYTMSITVNGQLLLCMLYESLRTIPGLSLIQVNTDGLTVKVPRKHLQEVIQAKSEWEKLTGLDLEQAFYEFMHIRDVNNYVAVYEGGKGVKRKGAYEYNVQWHQNHSALIVKRAAEAAIVNGDNIRDFMVQHTDDYNFLLRTKVPRSSKLVADYGYGLEEQLQNITRFFIAKDGPELVKIMPPLPKKPDQWRRMAVNKGLNVQECNHYTGIDRSKLNLDWYVEQAEKLVNFGTTEEEEEQ